MMQNKGVTYLLGLVGFTTVVCGICPWAAAAPHCSMEYCMPGPDGTLYCVDYQGGTSVGPPGAPTKLIGLAEFLDDMEESLADSMAEIGPLALDLGEPFYLTAQPEMEASSVVSLYDPFGGLATGFSNVKAYPNSGNVALDLELTEGEITRILDQVLSLTDGVLTNLGTLMIDDGSGQITVLTGGWTYSSAGGVVVNPDSDPGFIDALGGMLLVPDVRSRGFGLHTIVTFIGNVVRMGVGYLLDLFVPYTPPTYCLGPSIFDGSGQSCEDVDISCRDRLGEMCEMIHSLPGVTTAFKKCMKGRCACGGSFRDRLQISCASFDDCGPCSVWGVPAAGCNLGGSQTWYCYEHPFSCVCVNTVFHEMSHACGTMHRMDYWQAGECIPGDEA